VEGVGLGVLFAAASLVLLAGVPDTTLLGGYTIVLFLVSAALTSSPKSGLTLALSVLIGEVVAELVYFFSVYGMDVLLLPYVVGLSLFVGRIPLFILAGVFGGYVGREYFAEPKARSRIKRIRKKGKPQQRE
jgi:hypothetical protein